MCDVIHFMALMKELSSIFDINLPKPEVFCKIFEDNQICIAVKEFTRILTRTKHTAIKYHHLKIFSQNKIIPICYIDIK